MFLPIFNQPYAIDFHPTGFGGFKTTFYIKTLKFTMQYNTNSAI